MKMALKVHISLRNGTTGHPLELLYYVLEAIPYPISLTSILFLRMLKRKCNWILLSWLILLIVEQGQGWLVARRLLPQLFHHPSSWSKQFKSPVVTKKIIKDMSQTFHDPGIALQMVNEDDEDQSLVEGDWDHLFNKDVDPEEALVEFPIEYMKSRVDAYHANLTTPKETTYSPETEIKEESSDSPKARRLRLKVPWKNLVPSVISNKYKSIVDENDEHKQIDRMSWYDPADIACLDLRPEGFADNYAAIGIFSGDYFRAREMLWDYHLQWIRRTQLMRYLPLSASNICDSGLCSVDKAMTVLSFDRLMPLAQLMFISANSTCDMLRYLEREPFAKEGLLQWKICRMNRRGVDTKELHEIPRAPYIFLHMNGETNDSTHKVYDHISRQSRKFYMDAANSGDKSLRFDIFSRVSYLGDLSHLENGYRSGEVVMFNAKSHRDALSFIRRTPLGTATQANESLLCDTILCDRNNITMLGAINMLDCDGRAKISYFDKQQYPNYDNMGDESPEELLYQFQFKFDDPNAKEHHEENFRVLDALRRYNITIDVPDSFYEQPDNLQTYLNSLEESCKFVDDQSVSEFAYRALEGFGPDTPKRGRRKRRNT